MAPDRSNRYADPCESPLETFPLDPARTAEARGIAHTTVHANPLKTNADFSDMTNNFQPQFKLGSMHLVRFRSIRLITAPRILRPFLRQIQSRIDQTDPIRPAQCAKKAIFLFSQAAIPLARHAHGFITFLLKRAFVDVEARAHLGATQASVFPVAWSMTPR
jgi:hypothetical protein